MACKKFGATIGCLVSTCKANYHFGCVLLEGCKLAHDRAGFGVPKHAQQFELPAEHANAAAAHQAAAKQEELARRAAAQISPEERARKQCAVLSWKRNLVCHWLMPLTSKLWQLLEPSERWYRVRELTDAAELRKREYMARWIFERWAVGFKRVS